MTNATMRSRQPVRFAKAVFPAALMLLATGSCALKEAAFFAGLDTFLGSITTVVTGAPDGATVTLTGPIAGRSHVVDAQGYAFDALVEGNYTATITPPDGYSCSPTSASATISLATPSKALTFDCTQEPGTFALGITGLTGSEMLQYTLTGPTSRSGQAGTSGAELTGLQPGNYDWSVGQISGYDCSPGSGMFALGAGMTVTASVSCTPAAPQTGALSVSVLGTSAEVAYSGPASGGGTASSSPTVFDNLPVGSYSVSVTSPAGFTCSPQSTSAAVTAGNTTAVQFECQPQPGTISVTVQGATAQVDYSGPGASGGQPVGSTPVDFTGLPPGMYTVSITDPSGFTCTPPSAQVDLNVGATEQVQFSCTPSGGGQPTTVGISLDNFQGGPGAVPAGTYPRPLLDGGTTVGSIDISTIGTQTFYGTSPFRLGSGPNSGFRFNIGVNVNSQPYSVGGFAVCPLNTVLDATHTVDVTYRDGSLVSLGSDHIDSAPSCFWGMVPAGTAFIDVTGPNDRFIDINGLQLWQ